MLGTNHFFLISWSSKNLNVCRRASGARNEIQVGNFWVNLETNKNNEILSNANFHSYTEEENVYELENLVTKFCLLEEVQMNTRIVQKKNSILINI